VLLEVGRIAKAHGLQGEVIVALVTDRVERLAPGSRLTTDRGELEVAESHPHQHRFRVAFVGVHGREAAEALSGTILRAEAVVDDDEIYVHQIIGTRVVERDGTPRGTVESVQANPAHELLVLDSGALVPMVFVESCVDGVTTINPPAGLFDID
jgi:16S rRNA processing protein RimM